MKKHEWKQNSTRTLVFCKVCGAHWDKLTAEQDCTRKLYSDVVAEREANKPRVRK